MNISTLVLSICVIFWSGAAQASATLKQVQVSGGTQVDFLFDGKVGKSQVQTETFNDIIQITLTDASVYPAKISSVSGDSITKVFAYQYAPRTVRCRVSVKGKADDYKDRLQINTNGKLVTLRLEPLKTAARAAAAEPADSEERALMDRILTSQAAPQKAEVKAEAREAKSDSKPDSKNDSKSSESREIGQSPIAGGKPLPNPLGAFGKLAIVLGIFGMLVLAAKKFLIDGTRGGSKSSQNQTNKLLGLFKKKDRMIDVVTTHHLGPKKSIAVVKIAGRTLVLGVTNENINLITQISGTDSSHDYSAAEESLLTGLAGDDETPSQESTVAAFTKILRTETAKPQKSAKATAATVLAAKAYGGGSGASAASAPTASASQVAPAQFAADQENVRAKIRNRLEGLKQL